MTLKELIEAIEEEMGAIMAVQKDNVDPDSDQYKANQEALHRYLDDLAIIKEQERLDRELNMKEKELYERFQSDIRKAKTEKEKFLIGCAILAALVLIVIFSEETRVITSKAFGPLIGAVVRTFTIV